MIPSNYCSHDLKKIILQSEEDHITLRSCLTAFYRSYGPLAFITSAGNGQWPGGQMRLTFVWDYQKSLKY